MEGRDKKIHTPTREPMPLSCGRNKKHKRMNQNSCNYKKLTDKYEDKSKVETPMFSVYPSGEVKVEGC